MLCWTIGITSRGGVESKQPAASTKRKMMSQKGFSIFAFAMVTLLSCFGPVSSFFALPRVSRTDDAIIIDYEGVGYSPFSLGRGYGQIVDPGFVPLPSVFNPYGLVQPLPMFYNGWSFLGKQAATCGKGPATVPTARSLASERISYPSTYTTASAKKGAWPFLVVLRKSTDAAGAYFCSGTLISASNVLLAAQCLEKLSVYEISAVIVLVGMFKTDQSDVQMTRRISKVVIHSKYNAATYANDIAIISLDMPVIISKSVSPVCLPPASTDPDQYADQNAVIMGWDAIPPKTRESSVLPKVDTPPTPKNLEQALVSVLDNAACKSDPFFGLYVSDSTTCVSSAANDITTCTKDVGGPVVIGVPPAAPATSPVTWTIIGINSFTGDCAQKQGGLKTRVAAFADWIKAYNV